MIIPLYKYFKIWIVPPGIFILLLLLLVAYFFYCDRVNKKLVQKENIAYLKPVRIGIGFCLVLVSLLYLMSVDAVAQRAVRSLEYVYSRDESANVDAILVLGGAEARTRTAIQLQKQIGVDVVVSGYNGEAERMRSALIRAGVSSSKIYTEMKATNTIDNAKYILPIVLKNRYKKVFLVTSAYHMPRSMMNFESFYKKQGIEILPYPCGYYVPKEHSNSKPQWLPNMVSFWCSARAWEEYLGILELKLTR